MSNEIKIQYLNGLGLVAKTVRKIQSGRQYDKYFPFATKTDPILNKDGEVKDTVGYCKKIVASTLSDTRQLAPLLKRTSLQLTLIEVFAFVYDHIQYEIDKPNVEQIRRPARTWSDRKGDCDCMSVFVSSVLTNLGIPHSFRIVKMYGRNFYQHIYVIVPKQGKTDMSKRENYYVIDPVLDKFDQEAPKINFKTDFQMKNLAGIPIQYLNGLGTHNQNIELSGLGKEFDDFEGLDGTEEELGNAFNARVKRHLVNTHAVITKNPGRVSRIYNANALASAYKELINNWDSETAREGTLDRLSATEENLLRPEFQGLGDIIHGDDAELFGLMNTSFAGISGLEGKKSKARKSSGGGKAKKKKGVFTKIKTANKAVKERTKNVVAKTKKASAKTKKGLKKLGKKVIKSTTTPIRVGILAGMKINFGKLGSRMYWGLFPQSEAMSYGVTSEWWNLSNGLYNKLRGTFVNKLGGDESVLRKSIITGRAAKVAKRGTTMRGLGNASELFTNGLDELSGLGQLGEPTTDVAAIIASAGAVLTPLVIFAAKSFKGKKVSKNSKPDDGSQADNGNDSEAPGEEESVIEKYKRNVTDLIKTVNNNSGGGANSSSSEDAMPSDPSSPKSETSKDAEGNATANENTDKTANGSGKGKMIAIVGGGVLALGAILLIAKGKKKTAVSGVDGFTQKKRHKNVYELNKLEKNFKKTLKNKGVKMPHGYDLKNRKALNGKVKTIKIK